MKNGEERLLEATMQNKIPVGVAIDIAKAESPEAQRELLKAYESGQLNHVSIRTLRRVMEQRRLLGKKGARGGDKRTHHSLTVWSTPIAGKCSDKAPSFARPGHATTN